MDEMRYFLALLLAASCGLCFADERAEKMAAANELVELLHMGDMLATQSLDCVPKMAEVAEQARSLYKENPDKFGGITPQSKYWDDFERIYAKYSVESCFYIQPELVKHAYARALADRVSLRAIQAAVRFYSSPEGRVFASEALGASEKYCAEMKQDEEALHSLAQTNYNLALRKLIERYKADPK
jgi:hypothetical protein